MGSLSDIKLIFFGSSEFACPTLQAIQLSGADIILVVTQPDKPAGRGKKLQSSPIKQLADELKLQVYQPDKLKEDFLKPILDIQADLCLVVAYGNKIPEVMLNHAPLGCINVHPSILPKYRGASPIQYALLSGDEVTGITTMYMSKGWDDGDIIYQNKYEIYPVDDFVSLSDRLASEASALVIKTLIDLKKGVAPRIQQEHSLATFAPLIKPEDMKINWGDSAINIVNRVRAFSPKPGAFTFLSEDRINILRISVDNDIESRDALRFVSALDYDCGTIVSSNSKQGLIVKCLDGYLRILTLQPAGKKPMTDIEFLNGRKLSVGVKFI